MKNFQFDCWNFKKLKKKCWYVTLKKNLENFKKCYRKIGKTFI